MKIAVSVNEDKKLSMHFGRSKQMSIYSVEGDKISFLESRDVPSGLQSHNFSFLTDCEAVISGSIGPSMQEMLLSEGIKPYIYQETDDPIAAIGRLLGI